MVTNGQELANELYYGVAALAAIFLSGIVVIPFLPKRLQFIRIRSTRGSSTSDE